MKNRRELLKKLSLGAAWATPVIQSVSLPVHAQMTGGRFICTVSGSGTDNGNVSDTDMVIIVFDPDAERCSATNVLSPGDGFAPGPFDGNIIIGIDAGPNPQPNWDTDFLGDTNWSVAPNLGSENTNSGNFQVTATRLSGPNAGKTYTVALNIQVSGTANTTATVSVAATISEN